MKKVLAILGSALLLAASAMTFVSCDDGEADIYHEKLVMNISCNPSVEFVLDKDNKVVTANALNEEGNLIVSAQAFAGKTAEEAAKLFVEISTETGFLVSGSATVTENEITLSFSRDSEQITQLYDGVKNKVNEYLSAENITAQISKAEAMTKQQLEALVAECAPYVEMAQIQAMERMELVEQIYQSRKETAEFYSQELKSAYYESKAFIMEQAELEVIKSQLNVTTKAIVDGLTIPYDLAVKTIESTRKTFLVNEDSLYQVALKNFREAKVNYLKFREEVAAMEQNEITTAVTEKLANLDKLVNDAEQAILKAGADANAALDEAKANVTEAYNAIIAKIGDYSAKVNEHLTEVGKKQKTAQEAFFTKFETDYAAAITAAQNDWVAMKTALETPAPQA